MGLTLTPPEAGRSRTAPTGAGSGAMSDDLVKMARLAQRDDRMATGALYGDLADRIEELEAKLAKAVGLVDDMVEWGTWYGEALKEILHRLAELKGEKDE